MEESIDKNRHFIKFTDIIRYVGDGVRSYEEGERVYLANHIFCCGITKQVLNETHIFALCLRSTKPSDSTPYEVNVTLKKIRFVMNIECICQCPAGLNGKCKHCVALLYYLAAIKICDIEEATCTDVKQQWGHVKQDVAAMYTVVPISKFCHLNEKSDKIYHNYDTEKKVNFVDILTQGMDPKENNVELVKVKAAYRSSEVQPKKNEMFSIRHVARDILSKDIYPCLSDNFIIHENITDKSLFTYNMLPDYQKKFYEKIVKVDLESAINVCSDTIHQNNESWLQERKIRITASKAYSLCTYVDNKKPDWDGKLKKVLQSSFKGNKNTRYGLLCEEKAIEAYERQYDYQVVRLGLLINPKLSWLGYSPDGYVVNSHILEIKSLKDGKTMTASSVAEVADFLEKDTTGVMVMKKKHAYYCQVQLGMFVTNVDYAQLVLYSSFDDSCFAVRVDFDYNSVFEEYLPKLQFVYFTYMLKFLADPTNNINHDNEADENMNLNRLI